MSDSEGNGVSQKIKDQQIVKFIFDLSKEMNIEDTCGVVGNELELIALVRNCRFLYDKNLSDFKDVRKKNVAWGAIASVMHTKVRDVQQRWRSLREGYNKYKKDLEMITLGEVNSSSVRPWEFFDDMKFIEPYIVHRRRSSGSTYTEEIQNSNEDITVQSIANSDRSSDIMQLIQCIRLRPVLYDNKHSNYKCKESKIHAWNEVAQTVGASANECETKWKNLRERFGRERKLKILQSEKKKWEYFDALSFLNSHIKPRRHSIFRPILPKPALEDSPDNLTILSSLQTSLTANQSTSILKQLMKEVSKPLEDVEVPTENARIRLNSVDLEHVEFVDASNATTSQTPSASPTPSEAKLNLKDAYLSPSSIQSQISNDEDELFGQTITAELRRMPSGKKKMKIKAEIYKILYENESDT